MKIRTVMTFVLAASGLASVTGCAAGDEDGSAPTTNPSDTGAASDTPKVMAVSDVKDVVQVAAGAFHTCALRKTGEMLCWGENGAGQLGWNPSKVSSLSGPAALTKLGTVRAIAAGSHHSCALDEAGSVWCWGSNERGQLGRGEETGTSHVPTRVIAANGAYLSGVTALTAGASHTCASSPNGTYCWGDAQQRQIGAELSTGTSPVAVPLRTIFPAQAMAAGALHTCALSSSDHNVLCWGTNDSGQLGIGADTGPSAFPFSAHVFGARAKQLAVGEGHTCVLDEAGDVFCWGKNGAGQSGVSVGSSTPDHVNTPQKVAALSGKDTVAIAAGGNVTCAVRVTGQVMCLGSNSSAQLGIVASAEVFAAPRVVAAFRDGLAVTVGGAHACAIRGSSLQAGGAVFCWGANGAGQLGNGNNTGVVASELSF